MAKRQAPALKQRTKSEQTKKARSGKGTRGGAGRGQGRKKVLTYMEMILLGGACEDLWRRLMERKAWAEYRNQPHVKDIHQERIDSILKNVKQDDSNYKQDDSSY